MKKSERAIRLPSGMKQVKDGYMTEKKPIGGNGGVGSNHYRVFAALYDEAAYEYINMKTFPALFESLRQGRTHEIIVAVRNSIIGPVEEVTRIMAALDADGIRLQEKNEYAIDIHHALIGGAASSLASVKRVFSYTAALEQCRKNIEALGLEAVYHRDTWDAAVDVVGRNDPDECAIAPVEAAGALGGKILKENMSDIVPNRTVFKVFSVG